MFDGQGIGYIGLLRCRGWALELYSSPAFCRRSAHELAAIAERVFAAHIADPGAAPAALGFAYFEPPEPEFAVPGRLSAYWWEGGHLHRRVLLLPLDGSPPMLAPDAAERIGGPVELALIARAVAAAKWVDRGQSPSGLESGLKEICR